MLVARGVRFGLVAAMLTSCASSQGDADPDVSAGESVYRERVEDGNTWSCSTCHALVEPAADFRRPAHPIGDAAARPSYKNGQVTELREAVNSCLVEWMNAEPWTEVDPRWVELEGFLVAQAPAAAAALEFAIVDPPIDLTGGDAVAGRATFDSSCAVCHAAGGAGSDLAPPVNGRGIDPAYAAERVRHSGRGDSSVYDGLSGGIMPFWSADRLSDGELRDIVAFLAETAGGTTDPDPTNASGSGDDASGSSSDGDDSSSDSGVELPRNCPITHERVGWVAQMSDLFHGVGGLAEIVDDCTVVIHDFTYDGTGIDVRLYGGVDGDYDAGYPMTDDLVKLGGYNGELLEAVLPEGVTLEQLDGVSVWCVDVGIDFGSGEFAPP